MQRRRFLETTGWAAASVAAGVRGTKAHASDASGWRAFEVRTRLEVANASGTTRAWIPLALHDEHYQRRGGDTWKGNAASARRHRDKRYAAEMLALVWPPSETAPAIEVVSRVETRDRAVDLLQRPRQVAKESRSTLSLYLEPTKLIPTDGIVKATADEITSGRTAELDKARAIYEWIVENTFRDPKVLGCGTGNVKAMLESRNLGGKCADLNALFVGLARAAGIPARDVYGIRAGESKEFKSLGRGGDLSRAQHCRAEFYATGHGWIPVDPADVRKVVLEEPPGNRPLDDSVVASARKKLFGAWEMNWLAYNRAHDVQLPGSSLGPIPFLMYPQCETGNGRKDALDPATFQYQISLVEA